MESVEKCGLQPQTLSHNYDRVEPDWPHNEIVSPNSNNSTLLYIAVEYVKDELKGDSNPNISSCENFMNLQEHVGSFDPNMNSIAEYSPVYNDPNNYNPVVIHHLVSSDAIEESSAFVNAPDTNSSLETIPTVLYDTRIDNVSEQYLQVENSTSLHNGQNSSETSKESGVEILITDQATGISYSVCSQELLVKQEQLLEALSPGPLLDSELLMIDESTLKNNLPQDLINGDVSTGEDNNIVSNFISDFSAEKEKFENNIEEFHKLRKKTVPDELECEDKLMSRVFNIVDKPIPSRARATLPETYLKIMKVGEEWAVFAKKCIRKRTQFGPVQGILKNREDIVSGDKKLELLLKDDENRTLGLDISDEENSNWMCFIRRAESYEEQNLVVSQQENSLYFTVIRNILPKQELKVGYSFIYANQHNLPALEKKIVEEQWLCFECTEYFATSEDLQKHLSVHEERGESVKFRKKNWKSKKKLLKVAITEAWQCKICEEVFNPPKYSVLRQHLSKKHNECNDNVEENFLLIRNYKCEKCYLVFQSENLFKVHNLQHSVDLNNDEFDNETCHVCPACNRKFVTQKQLVMHVSSHSLPKYKIIPERFQCPICYTSYPLRERLQRHMLIHGPEESKPLQCHQCKKRFMTNSALICHLKTHISGENIYECPICKDRFDNVPKLKAHVQKHCVNNTYTCPQCNKKFKAYSIIRKHIRAFHSEQKHICQHCSKEFPTMDKLKIHLLKYSDHREFLCSNCGKQFKRKDKLTEHCKRVHSEERENNKPKAITNDKNESKKFIPKVEPTDFHRFIYKCHPCLIGFKRRGMLVNHLAKRHPDISLDSVPELNLPILRATKDYYCQYCDKVYKSSSKRKLHILKNHPGAALPISNRKQGVYQEVAGLPNMSFSQTVGSVTTSPQSCKWCHKQYASKAKLLHHQRKEHLGNLKQSQEDNDDKSNKDVNTSEEIRENDEQEFPIYKQNDYVVTDKVFDTNISEEFVDDPEPDIHFEHLENIGENEVFNQNETFGLPNSHLYRLLTNANNMVPPR